MRLNRLCGLMSRSRSNADRQLPLRTACAESAYAPVLPPPRLLCLWAHGRLAGAEQSERLMQRSSSLAMQPVPVLSARPASAQQLSSASGCSFGRCGRQPFTVRCVSCPAHSTLSRSPLSAPAPSHHAQHASVAAPALAPTQARGIDVLLQLSAWNLLVSLLAAATTAVCGTITVFLVAMWPMLRVRLLALLAWPPDLNSRRTPAAFTFAGHRARLTGHGGRNACHGGGFRSHHQGERRDGAPDAAHAGGVACHTGSG